MPDSGEDCVRTISTTFKAWKKDMNEEIHLLIFSENDTKREELVQMLDSKAGIVVVGKANSGKEIIAKAENQFFGILIISVDNQASSTRAIEITRELNQAGLPVQVIIISEYIFRDLAPAVKAGAVGLLASGISGDELLSAIRRIDRWSSGSVKFWKKPGLTGIPHF